MAVEDFGGALAPLPIRLGSGFTAAQHARLCADLCAVKRTARLARLYVSQDAGSPFASAVVYYNGQNGAGLAYAPTPTTNDEGDVTLTWPSYWEDEYGVQHAIKIRQAKAAVTATRMVTVEIINLGVRVRMFTDAGVAAASGFSLSVW